MNMNQQLYRPEQDVYDSGLKSLSNNMPSQDYINYLTLYINDELTTGTVNKPVSYKAQRAKLITIMQRQYPYHGFRQTISKLDFNLAQFHELIFAMHFVTHEIEITNNIGYDKGELAPGVYRARPVAYAEFKIIDPELKQLVSAPPESKLKIANKTSENVTAEIKVSNGNVLIVLSTGDKYQVKKLRNDGAPHVFIKYLVKNTDNAIPKAVIQTEVEGCTSKTNMTELVKQCGFTGEFLPFKQLFFAGTTAGKVRIADSVNLDKTHIELLMRIAKPIA